MGTGLTNGQPTKFSCQSARYFSRSLAFTYSQYAFSNSQTCASSFAEFCPRAVAVNARNKVMVRNMCRSYLTKQDGIKVSTQIITMWRITDKTAPHVFSACTGLPALPIFLCDVRLLCC